MGLLYRQPGGFLCVRGPNIPFTGISERHGSGKVNMGKGGQNGTRIWQCPWFLYPKFCDFLLGRVAANPFGFPQIFRPKVFSLQYPWLYCNEVDVEGEDLLGIDYYLRAFYRRAIVTAKYQPLEMGNSLHINAQMLTIPGTQYAFVGTNPLNAIGAIQTVALSMQGPPAGGTFTLVLTGTATGGIPVTYTTEGIKTQATGNDIAAAVRKAMGITPNQNVVGCGGSAGGPWTMKLVSNTGYDVKVQTDTSGASTGLTFDASTIQPHTFDDTDLFLTDAGTGKATRIDQYKGNNPNPGEIGTKNFVIYSFELLGRPAGTFCLEATLDDGTKRRTPVMTAKTFHPDELYKAMKPIVAGIVDRESLGSKDSTAAEYIVASWVSSPYVNGALQDSDPVATPYATHATDTKIPVRFYVRFWGTTKKITSLAIADLTTSGGKPYVKVEASDPNIADRLDSPVGKLVPMGEFTFQRQQVLSVYLPFLMNACGCVNMFTFAGFPPWTLMLSGMDAKQTRLPNGTPAWDMTFKFAFNPYTHQALFRPATMRWEFVRGILQTKLPNNVAMPPAPLRPDNQRASVSDAASRSAWVDPSAPRTIPSSIDPKSGKSTNGGSNPDGSQMEMSGLSETSGDIAQTLNLMSQEFSIDDTDGPTLDSEGNWEGESGGLASLIARTVAVAEGQADDDQDATATSGIAQDIVDAQAAGAEWFASIETGEDTSGEEMAFGMDPMSAYDHARGAIQHGVPATEQHARILGLASASEAQERFGSGVNGGGASGMPTAGQGVSLAASKVGAGTSIESMSGRIFDLGFPYGIVDFSPIAWLQ